MKIVDFNWILNYLLSIYKHYIPVYCIVGLQDLPRLCACFGESEGATVPSLPVQNPGCETRGISQCLLTEFLLQSKWEEMFSILSVCSLVVTKQDIYMQIESENSSSLSDHQTYPHTFSNVKVKFYDRNK